MNIRDRDSVQRERQRDSFLQCTNSWEGTVKEKMCGSDRWEGKTAVGTWGKRNVVIAEKLHLLVEIMRLELICRRDLFAWEKFILEEGRIDERM